MNQASYKIKPLRAEDLAVKFGKIDSKIILYNTSGHLHAISCYVELAIPPQTSIVKLYDGSIPILSIDRKSLIQTITDRRSVLKTQGCVWVKPQYEDSIELDYKIVDQLFAEGDIKGLIFWIEGKAIAG